MKSRFLSLAHRARGLFLEHQDALLVAGRVGVSATLAYLVASLQHLPQTYWPVMSAVIVARGGTKGAGGSAADRLVGTLAGAGVGMAAAFLHRFGLPDWALLFLAMAPMAFLSADNTAFRAAPMAAMIVLSATTSGKSGLMGLGVAGLRVMDVGLGTLVALFVSYVVLPSNPLKGLRKTAGALMMPLANLLALGVKTADGEARGTFARVGAKARKELREVVVAARQIRAGAKERDAAETLPNLFAAALSRTHGTIVFINRALAAAPQAAVSEALRPFVRDARARLGAIHHLLTEGVPVESGAALDASVVLVAARIERLNADGAAHLEALPFLLQTLRDDLNDLAAAAAAISGPPKARGAQAAAPAMAQG